MMRDMHNLALKSLDTKTTIEEDLVWWSAINLWAWMITNPTMFDDNEVLLLYSDWKFNHRLPGHIVGSYSGSVTMPMLRTNTAKAMEYLMPEYMDKVVSK